MEQNKTGRYLKYAFGEIVLVVIGILIALQLNNWNEHRKLKTEEIKILTEMKSALESDGIDIQANIREHELAANSCTILGRAIAEGLPYHDSLSIHFSRALNTTRFVHTSGPYETLKIKGPDLVENDSLRLLLSDYYDKWVGYQINLQNNSSRDFELAKERQFELFKNFDLGNGDNGIIPVNYAALRENQYYKSWLGYTHDLRQWEATNFHRLKQKSEKIIQLIDQEINE